MAEPAGAVKKMQNDFDVSLEYGFTATQLVESQDMDEQPVRPLALSDLAAYLHAIPVFSPQVAAQIVHTFIETIKEALEQGDDVLIGGLGKFMVKEQPARPVPNFGKTPMMLEARNVVKVKWSTRLCAKINAGDKAQEPCRR